MRKKQKVWVATRFIKEKFSNGDTCAGDSFLRANSNRQQRGSKDRCFFCPMTASKILSWQLDCLIHISWLWCPSSCFHAALPRFAEFDRRHCLSKMPIGINETVTKLQAGCLAYGCGAVIQYKIPLGIIKKSPYKTHVVEAAEGSNRSCLSNFPQIGEISSNFLLSLQDRKWREKKMKKTKLYCLNNKRCLLYNKGWFEGLF